MRHSHGRMRVRAHWPRLRNERSTGGGAEIAGVKNAGVDSVENRKNKIHYNIFIT